MVVNQLKIADSGCVSSECVSWNVLLIFAALMLSGESGHTAHVVHMSPSCDI